MTDRSNAGNRLLDAIESAGNRVPHPTLLFIFLAAAVVLISWLAESLNWQAQHPVSGETIAAVNLLSRTGFQLIIENAVDNFTGFAPVGTVLVAMLGIGIADQSGLLDTVMRVLVTKAPDNALSFAVVFAGVLSSLAADAGYVVLIPLAASLFAASGRHPLGGIAAAFAGVSAGYSANLAIGPLDAMLAGITTEAANLVDPQYRVSPAANYYFMAASTLIIAALAATVTERIVLPRLGPAANVPTQPAGVMQPGERRGLRATGAMSAGVAILLAIALIPEDGLLRSEGGGIVDGPLTSGIVTLISFYFALAGTLYGFASRRFTRGSDVIDSMETAMKGMAGYLVLMFFAAQFVSYFAWTQLGLISAVKGAELLRNIGTHGTVVVLMFVLLAALINLLVGSASAKWSLIAPIFVPMLMLYGISPEATQVAYRIGDSTTNIITPLMPYFGIVIAFAQRYDSTAGVGTIIAMMLPYSIALLLGWSAMLSLWLWLGWPLGV